MVIHVNPFYHMTAIRESDMFFGRTKIVKDIYALLGDKQNVAIVGPRRIGKSSILTCIHLPEFQRRFTDRDFSTYLFVHLDLEEHHQKNANDWLQFMCHQLIWQCQKMLHIEISPTEDLSLLLDDIRQHGLYPVLLLDELDSIVGDPLFPPKLFTFLRSLANQQKVSYVTASVAPLETLSHSGLIGSPFFNIFHFFTLRALTHDESVQLITEPSQRAGCPFSPDEIARVYELAGRHPFFLQRTCYFLFEMKTHGNIAPFDIDQVASQAYEQLRPHFEYTWNHLSPKQEECLKHEARRKHAGQRDMPELAESALFRDFVRQKYNLNLDEAEIIAKYLQKVLEQLDDYIFLGESKLGYLNIVYAQCPPDASVSQRGEVIRRLLFSAFEELKPKQSSNSNDMRIYDILKYCYFDPGLTNEQIAARLSISARTFYRDRDKAVKKVLNKLLEFEVKATRWY
jgi:hypothetical protein